MKPILFSTPMVQAILAGRKQMTRRLIKFKKKIKIDNIGFSDSTPNGYFEVRGPLENGQYGLSFFKLKYEAGDILWVRETFFDFSWYKESLLFDQLYGNFVYKADKTYIGEHCWKPSIHMPKIAARLFLKVTKVRIEKLQTISNEEAIAEGIEPLNMSAHQLSEMGQLYFDYSKPKQFFCDGIPPFWSFNSLWCSINGAESWDANPYVFVYEFEVISKDQAILKLKP